MGKKDADKPTAAQELQISPHHMKPSDHDLLQSAVNNSASKSTVFLTGAIFGVVGTLVVTKWIFPESISAAQSGTPEATTSIAAVPGPRAPIPAPSPQGSQLDPNLVQLASEIEKLKTELRSRPNGSTEKAAMAMAADRWAAQIDQIIVKLERVTSENINAIGVPISYSVKQKSSYYSSEESRINGILREQESQARSIVYELKAQQFPYTDELDSLVKHFADTYSFYLQNSRQQYDWINRFGQERAGDMDKTLEKMKAYQKDLAAIKALKTRR